MMDEFDDVSELEKSFFRLWEEYIISTTVIPDYCIPSKFIEFIRRHAKVLIKCNLREKLLLHMYHFLDSRLISSHHLSLCLAEFDSAASKCTHDATINCLR